MYETLIMLKPAASFSMDDLRAVVIEVLMGRSAEVAVDQGALHVTSGSGSLWIGMNSAPHVVEESNEIADQFGLDCRDCRVRFEMAGNDPDMQLFNDYLLINGRLHATGKFVVFDTEEGKLLFDDPA